MAHASDRSADAALVAALVRWYDVHERPLPWRTSTPWGVLVSEFMLQQTPVDRVLPVWDLWMQRWPNPGDLAAATVGDALRAWGRLGYPRRARRLHESAVVITREHDGRVPSDEAALRALPGVGEYTTAAVLAFAYEQRSVVLDTNVRRVVARAVHGVAAPPGHITSMERARADLLWPADDARSARWSAAVMEFGALVCTARSPACQTCPIRRRCAWLSVGQPPAASTTVRQADYAGSDRQARGHLMSVLRDAHRPLSRRAVTAGWPEAEQAQRALDSLVVDGLVARRPGDRYALPD